MDERGIVAFGRSPDRGSARSGKAHRSSPATLAVRAIELIDDGDVDGARALLTDLVHLDLAERARKPGPTGGATGAA